MKILRNPPRGGFFGCDRGRLLGNLLIVWYNWSMKKIFSWFLGMVISLMGFSVLVLPVSAITCPTGSARTSADDLSLCNVPTEVDIDNGDTSLFGKLSTIINVALALIAFVAVAFIIIAGVQFTTSQGDPGKIAKAKHTIMYAVIGLVVALLAFAIVNFVLTNIF